MACEVVRYVTAANALPSANMILRPGAPSMCSPATISADAESRTTTPKRAFFSRANAIAPSMMTRASASEMGAAGSVGAGACAKLDRPSASVRDTTKIKIARHDNRRSTFMLSSHDTRCLSISNVAATACRTCQPKPCAPIRSSPLRLFEISQIRRQLPLLGRHQVAIGAEHISLVADFDVVVVLATIVLLPDRSLLVRLATVGLVDRPRTRQCMINDGDVVMEDVGIGLVEVNSLLDDGLIVLVQ